MIELYNQNNQLQVYQNGVSEFYSFADIKSISPYIYSSGPYSSRSGKEFVIINFINESRNSSLKLDTSLITEPPFVDVYDLVNKLSEWMNISTSGELDPATRGASIIRATSDDSTGTCFSVSFANVGAADGTIDGVILKPGEIVNFDAGTLNNTLRTIAYDATGTEFLIAIVE